MTGCSYQCVRVLDTTMLHSCLRLHYDEWCSTCILDNAPYHHGMDDKWKNPLQATKTENATLLPKLEAESIEIVRGNKAERTAAFKVPSEGEQFPRAPIEPSVDELSAATFKELKARHPDQILTCAEKYFKDNDLG